MVQERIDFADSETALTTVRAMASTLGEAVSIGDVRAIKTMYGMLADAAVGVRRLVHRLGSGLTRTALRGAFPPERWKDLSPEEILNDLQNLVGIDEVMIEIKRSKIPGSRTAEGKRLSQEIDRLSRTLKGKVANAKAWIQKHWPDAWTEREEANFQRWL